MDFKMKKWGFTDSFWDDFWDTTDIKYTTKNFYKKSLTKFKDGQLSLEIELPGVKKEDIFIYLNNFLLTIKYKKKDQELSYIENLEEEADPDRTKARLLDGVLYLTLVSKTEKPKETLIKIE